MDLFFISIRKKDESKYVKSLGRTVSLFHVILKTSFWSITCVQKNSQIINVHFNGFSQNEHAPVISTHIKE